MIKARFDIIMTLCDYSDHIDFGITYATSLFLKETVERMLEDYITILLCFIDDRTVKIDELELREYDEETEPENLSLDVMSFNFGV